MSVGNPARGGNAAGAMQSYEVRPTGGSPLRGDARGVGAVVARLPDPPGERRPLRPAVELLVRAGRRSRRRYPFAAGPIEERTAPGHLGATLHDDAVDGAFAISVGADTRFVVLQIRPVADRGCTAVDFRWDFQA